MYALAGPDDCLETLLTLGRPFTTVASGDAVADTRAALTGYLRDIQPDVWQAGGTDVRFVADQLTTTRLARAFGDDEIASGGGHGAPAPWKLKLLERAYAMLAERDEMLAMILRIAVDAVFTTMRATAPGSMTTGTAIGLVWIDPRPDWSVQDAAEALIHETTHTLLMLDERRQGHFTDYALLRRPEHFARSAIRHQPRPLNAVIHSLVAACELLAARDRWLGHDWVSRLHPESASLRRQAVESLDSIAGLPEYEHLTTPRVRGIVADAADLLSTDTFDGATGVAVR